jgi:hypothetical protein
MPRPNPRRWCPAAEDFSVTVTWGVTAATDGLMRAQVTLANGVIRQTGWHFHVCEAQFIFAVRGWIDLQFEGGRTIRLDFHLASAELGLHHRCGYRRRRDDEAAQHHLARLERDLAEGMPPDEAVHGMKVASLTQP